MWLMSHRLRRDAIIVILSYALFKVAYIIMQLYVIYTCNTVNTNIMQLYIQIHNYISIKNQDILF